MYTGRKEDDLGWADKSVHRPHFLSVGLRYGLTAQLKARIPMVFLLSSTLPSGRLAHPISSPPLCDQEGGKATEKGKLNSNPR